MGFSRYNIAAVLLNLAVVVLAHGDDEHDGMDMGSVGNSPMPDKQTDTKEINNYDAPSYYGLDVHANMMLAHIVLMVAAWFFVLPLGVMLSVAKSRFTLPVQFLFLVLNGVGVVFGTVYNVNTPDLYENNAHHKIGWIATWVMTAQVIMSLLFTYSGRGKTSNEENHERAAFLHMPTANKQRHSMRPYSDYRWSGDSGQGTERSSVSNSRDISPTDPHRRDTFDGFEKPEPLPADDDDDDEEDNLAAESHAAPQSPGSRWFRIRRVDTFLSVRVSNLLSAKILRLIEVAYNIIDRTILILGFIALVTGGVTYAGIFRGANVLNGLAHFVKGGIFFWYGLLTLGRWMGCFADMGWSWNIKPDRSEVGQWKARMPSAEFVESFVIWLYGCTNVFLEHLAAWGDVWTAQDLEHVSISIMFFGGGLCGMLIESRTIRRCLNVNVENMSGRTERHSEDEHKLRSNPKAYEASLNPMPALIILLLGVMMSSHHQASMVSTMVHKQWGNLLVGFAFARIGTYILTYLSPPTSIFPSRPPTELVSGFCLISGGLVFMASTKDIIHYMETADLMAMFVFTVVMGLTAFIMAYEIVVLSLKGWATQKELKWAPTPARY